MIWCIMMGLAVACLIFILINDGSRRVEYFANALGIFTFFVFCITFICWIFATANSTLAWDDGFSREVEFITSEVYTDGSNTSFMTESGRLIYGVDRATPGFTIINDIVIDPDIHRDMLVTEYRHTYGNNWIFPRIIIRMFSPSNPPDYVDSRILYLKSHDSLVYPENYIPDL